ncbi:MAG: ECF transporter S component [Ruminococcus sp.]|nr:ECF transporter S component [Ruminococcus sp.]
MEAKRKNRVKDMTLAAMFLALGLCLPFLTGQIPKIGNMLLPMHIPVILCGLICGWKYGFAVGFITPLLRSVLFGKPVLFYDGAAMAFELAAYGLTVGLLYSRSRWKCVVSLYRSMIAAMLSGRIVWGVAKACMLGLGENGFTLNMFVAGAFLNAIPGIILQLVLIPAVMIALNRTGLVPFSRSSPAGNGEI